MAVWPHDSPLFSSMHQCQMLRQCVPCLPANCCVSLAGRATPSSFVRLLHRSISMHQPSMFWESAGPAPARRLLRVVGIRRRAQGSPFRWIDKISDVRQEFSFGARRLSVSAIAIAIAVHW